MIEYRPLHTLDELNLLFQLQMDIWGVHEGGATPGHVFRAITYNGCAIFGAWDGDRVVGFAFMIPSRRGDSWYLWSDMVGVHPDYQGQGIGFELKQCQRQWALENDYDVIKWTYDPMQRGNAKFNLRQLGGISNTYLANFYGVMSDALNAGMESDRLEITWDLRRKRVTALADGQNLPPRATTGTFVLKATGSNLTTHMPAKWDEMVYCAEIPYHLNTLKQSNIQLAKDWQFALRTIMLAAFKQGYSACDFIIEDQRCWYILMRI